jgi:hypothetical protein
MGHSLYRVTAVKVVAPYTLEIAFDDATVKTINFKNALYGEMYAPLRDERVFNRVKVDSEVHTIVFPNGADFEPAILHDWEDYEGEILRRVSQWEEIESHQS